MKSQQRRKVSLRLSIGMFIFSVIGWPLSALTIAKGEPPIVLALSWLSLMYGAITAILVAENGDS